MADRIVIIGTGLSDTIDVRAEVQAYEVYGRKGNDLIYGSALDDVIVGEEGNDDLFGGAGNDLFLIGPSAGADQIDGGAGYDAVRGDDGDTIIQFRKLTVGQSIEEINGGAGNNTLAGTSASNTLDLAGTLLINIGLIDGDKGNDIITGTASNDRIKGGAGYDTLNGGGGLDIAVFSGKASNYQITMGDGVVTVRDLAGTDGIDRLTGISYLEFSDSIVDLTGGKGGTPPSAVADAASGAEDTSITIDVLANDSSSDGKSLAVTAVTQGANGSVTINPDNTVSYIPHADFAGSDSFTYTASSGPLSKATATVTVTVLPQPDAPVAQNDDAKTTTGVPVVMDVLANDSDPDGDGLVVTDFTQPANGIVTQNGDGTLSYIPANGFIGSDAFTYTVTDQTLTSTATVSLDIAPAIPPIEELNFRQILTAIPENNWVRVNLNHFEDVWTPFEHRANGGNRQPAAVIGAWSSMAWDSERGDLIFWGGGHANYPGNEVYRWRSSSLEWESASLPSEVVEVALKQFEAVDGYLNAPTSSHTYDNSEYLPIVDRFVTFGGAAWNTGGAFVRTDGATLTGPYFWDPSKADDDKVGGLTGSQVNPALFPNVVGGEMWENRDNFNLAVLAGYRKGMVQGTTEYAEENGKDVIYFGRIDLWKYTVHDLDDPSKDTYEKVGSYHDAFVGDGAGAISTDLNIYLRTSAAEFVMWDLNKAGPSNRNENFLPSDPSGTFDFAHLSDYGMDYDPIRDVFVLWKGDSEVWALTPPSQVSTVGWTLAPLMPDAANDLPNVATGTTGVLGKWKYAADQDIFLGVNDARNGDVWIYKPDDWQPSNSLPQLSVASAPGLATQPGDVVALADLIDWSDADGDTLRFNFRDLSADATSGHLVLGGQAQNAGQDIVVSAEQLALGDLLWVAGAVEFDDVAISVSDPFGSSPVSIIRIPTGSNIASSGVLGLEAVPDTDSLV